MSSTLRFTAVFALVLLSLPATAQVCYRQPFGNPDLEDGFGSTCCGRSNPHRGLDYPQATGTPIPAVGAGTVAVITYNGCLGNVIVLRHDDGWYSGYSHMVGRTNLNVGDRVPMGGTVGQVGSTGSCAQGAHLHLTISAYIEGYWRDPVVDPWTFINARTTCNRAPIGFLDAASCTGGISGWAQDPDAPASAISAQLSLGGPTGTPGVPSFAVKADLSRPDLCAAYGCGHGFAMPVPLSFFDGRERQVYAYGVDASAGTTSQLSNVLKLTCTPEQLPTAGLVRREVTAAAFAAWKFSSVDTAPLSDAAIDALADGPALLPMPNLVKEADRDETSVLDGDVLRPIGSMAAFTANRFQTSAIAVQPAGALAPVLRGAGWPAFPFLVQNSKGQRYFLDAPPALWAKVLGSSWPARMVAGTSTEVSLTLLNRGSVTWTDRVSLQSADGKPSVFCDAWGQCDLAARVRGQVARGEQTTVRFQVRAPKTVGLAQTCFELRLGDNRFFDAPSPCVSVQVDAPPASDPAGPGPGEPSASKGLVRGGCSAVGGAGPAFALLALVLRRRRT